MYALKASSFLTSGYYGDITPDLWTSSMLSMAGGRPCDGPADWGMAVHGDRGHWQKRQAPVHHSIREEPASGNAPGQSGRQVSVLSIITKLLNI